MKLYLDLLKQLVSFKSVSFDPKYLHEIERTLAWYKKLFSSYNFQVEIIHGFDNPIIYAEYQTNPEYQTALVYGHYDVQPASIEDGWDSEPFELKERAGRLYARGVVDNKGQHLVHLATILKLVKLKKLAYNIKFFIEGNEETGSPSIEKFFKKHKKQLACDFVMISDGELVAGHPNINAGYRGITNCKVIAKTARTDLHSGIYGGTTPNAALELSRLLSRITDEHHKIKIPGFYDNVTPIAPEIKKLNQKIPFNLKEYKLITGAKSVLLPKNMDYYTQVSMQPTIEISGISSGYTGAGFKSIIPYKAVAKVNFRLVKNQNPEKILNLFSNYLKKLAPKYLDLQFEFPEGSEGSVEAVQVDINNRFVNKAKDLLTKVYKQKVLITHHGATLPMMSSLDKVIRKPIVDIPLVNEDCNMHGANENYEIGHLQTALAFSEQFFSTK